MRRASHETVGVRTVANIYRPVQMTEAVLLAESMVKEPSEYGSHCRRFVIPSVVEWSFANYQLQMLDLLLV